MLSRTDSIGDVVLTLPMAGFIRKHLPKATILFLGKTYTKDVVELSEHVSTFVNYDELQALDHSAQIARLKELRVDVIVHVFPKKELAWLAKQAGIPLRVGTRNRFYHWFTCNQLLKLSRKNSPLHEAQLNLHLLQFLNIQTTVSLNEIPSYYGFSKIPVLDASYKAWIDPQKFNLILHPRSKGSAREWGLQNFEALIRALPKDRVNIFISGTADDAKSMSAFLAANTDAMDITGKLSLQQFVAFIYHCDGLVAASTGPLHIAAALNKTAIGLFSPRRPIHPGRWQPLGNNARALVYDEACEKCAAKQTCDCITKITPQQVVDLVLGNKR